MDALHVCWNDLERSIPEQPSLGIKEFLVKCWALDLQVLHRG